MTTRVALFFDGKNFYSSWRDAVHDPQKFRVDFQKMAEWLTKKIHPDAQFVGAKYYTAVNEEETALDAKLIRFLDRMQLSNKGYHVYRCQRKEKKLTCTECGFDIPVRIEKEVDTKLVVDMTSLALKNSFDVAILLSGDLDFRPALQFLRHEGIPVHIAMWSERTVSQQLLMEASGFISLMEGKEEFLINKEEEEDIEIDHDKMQIIDDAVFNAICTMHKRFGRGYVGRSYFIRSWKDISLDKLIMDACNIHSDAMEVIQSVRESSIRRLQEAGRITVEQRLNERNNNQEDALFPVYK